MLAEYSVRGIPVSLDRYWPSREAASPPRLKRADREDGVVLKRRDCRRTVTTREGVERVRGRTIVTMMMMMTMRSVRWREVSTKGRRWITKEVTTGKEKNERYCRRRDGKVEDVLVVGVGVGEGGVTYRIWGWVPPAPVRMQQ